MKRRNFTNEIADVLGKVKTGEACHLWACQRIASILKEAGASGASIPVKLDPRAFSKACGYKYNITL